MQIYLGHPIDNGGDGGGGEAAEGRGKGEGGHKECRGGGGEAAAAKAPAAAKGGGKGVLKRPAACLDAPPAAPKLPKKGEYAYNNAYNKVKDEETDHGKKPFTAKAKAHAREAGKAARVAWNEAMGL